jgi:hypothetical protein
LTPDRLEVARIPEDDAVQFGRPVDVDALLLALEPLRVTLVQNSDVGRAAPRHRAQVMRWDTGMPRRVITLMTLQPAAMLVHKSVRSDKPDWR